MLFCGSVTNFRPDGSFTYTPAAAFRGVDYFFYRLTRGAETSAPIAVRSSSVTPVGVTDTYSFPHPQPQSPTAFAVDARQGVLSQRPEHGSDADDQVPLRCCSVSRHLDV